MKKGIFIVAPLVLAGIGLVAPQKVTINGKSVEGDAIIVAGETYVPLKALKAAGATAVSEDGKLKITWAAGGANQLAALEGGIGDWLFDGIWRFRVTAVRPNDDGRPGWLIDVELKNGTTADNIALDGTGFESLQLVMDDDNVIKQPYNITDIVRPVGQGSTIKESLRYYDDDGNGRKPVKLILRLTPDDPTKAFLKGMKLGYTVPEPSFRISLVPKKA